MTYAESVRDAILSGACAYLGQVDNANRFFNELSPVDLPNFAKYWRPRLCNEDPADVPDPEPPFQGGQCDALYRVRTTTDGGTTTSAPSRDVRGPLSSITFSPNPVIIPPSGAAVPVTLTVVGQFGTFQATANQSGAPNEVINLEPFIFIIGGAPDNCGDPPVSIPPFPPAGDTYNISPTYVDNSGDTVNLNGTVTLFAPVLIAPVTVIAPVKVDLGGVQFNGTLELAPNFNFNFGQPPSIPKPGSGEETPEPDDPLNVPTTDEDDSPRSLIGIKVTANATGNTRNTIIPQSGAPTLYLPRVGNAYFRVRNRAGLSWYGPIPVKTRSEFVPVPRNVDAVFGTVDFDVGWEGTTTQVFRGDIQE